MLTLLLTKLFFKAATADAQAAVPQALVSPAPLSHTFTFSKLMEGMEDWGASMNNYCGYVQSILYWQWFGVL